MEHFIVKLILKFLKEFLKPVFGPDELPRLYTFFPSEQWYKEQQQMKAFSTNAVKLKMPFGSSPKLILALLFWELKPGKIMSCSLACIILLAAFRVFIPHQTYTSLFIIAFIVFFTAVCFAANNLIEFFEYLVYETRNKHVVKKLYNKHNHYSFFIEAYHIKSHFKIKDWIISTVCLILGIALMAGIIVVGITVWN